MSEVWELERWDEVDKSDWPKGRWNSEPDRKQWRDKETDLFCLALRGPGGQLNGYVGVPRGHSLYGKDYDKLFEECFNCGSSGPGEVEAHGGLTFSGTGNDQVNFRSYPGEPNEIWIFGFDCAHSGDYTPKHGVLLNDISAGYDGYPPTPASTYKTLGYVTKEVESLARQLMVVGA